MLIENELNKWDTRFKDLAKHIAQWSKDPSTKVGAVITNHKNKIVGLGYNGFPIGVDDTEKRYEDRPIKLLFTCHAELNAILNANSSVEGCSIYIWPLFSCNECAKAVIQSGIIRVVAPRPSEERFASQYKVAQQMYKEAGVEMVIYEKQEA